MASSVVHQWSHSTRFSDPAESGIAAYQRVVRVICGLRDEEGIAVILEIWVAHGVIFLSSALIVEDTSSSWICWSDIVQRTSDTRAIPGTVSK